MAVLRFTSPTMVMMAEIDLVDQCVPDALPNEQTGI
jgi:hypothetical protein